MYNCGIYILSKGFHMLSKERLDMCIYSLMGGLIYALVLNYGLKIVEKTCC